MVEEETALILEELKKKYPNMTDEQLLDIVQTGAEKGLVTLPQPIEEKPPTAEPGLDIVKALKSGADLDEIMRFMVIDNWVRERFGKGKDVPPELKEMLENVKAGKKEAASDLDAFIDRMMKYELIESFMEGRKARSQPPQPQPTVDVEKAIREIGDKMAEALRTHKLEDEKARAEERAELHKKRAEEAEAKLIEHIKTEEEEKKLEAKLKEKITPIQEQFDKKVSTIAEILKGVEPEKRKGLILDLGEMISEEVGDEIKARVVDGLKSAFSEKEGVPVTTTPEGKLQVDWYKLGERGLKTLEKFIEKLPTQAPPRGTVKEMPRLPTPPTSTTLSATPTPLKQESETKPETKPEPEPKATPPQPQPTETKPKREPEETQKPEQKPKEVEKPSEPRATAESKKSRSVATATSRS